MWLISRQMTPSSPEFIFFLFLNSFVLFRRNVSEAAVIQLPAQSPDADHVEIHFSPRECRLIRSGLFNFSSLILFIVVIVIILKVLSVLGQ